MVLDGQRMGDERDWVLVGFFVTCSSSAEKRFIRLAKQDEMGLWDTCTKCMIGDSFPTRVGEARTYSTYLYNCSVNWYQTSAFL